MEISTKKSQSLNPWLVCLMLLCAFFSVSCAGDGDDGEFETLSAASLDPNYMDHGLVNVTGNTITTKIRTRLPHQWKNGAEVASGPGGVRIDTYMFYFDTTSFVLKVKDLRSGVSKDLKANAEYYRKLIGADRILGRNIWTMLRGFVNNQTGDAENAMRETYRLLV